MEQITLNLSNEQTVELAKSIAFMDGYQAGVADTLTRMKRQQVDLLLTRRKASPIQSQQKEKTNVASDDAAKSRSGPTGPESDQPEISPI